MRILFDLRTLDQLPRTVRHYLAAVVDSFLPAMAPGDEVTVLMAKGAPRPFQQIEQRSVAYLEAEHSARSAAGAWELQGLVALRGVEVYCSADPLMRPPGPVKGRAVKVIFAVEELQRFLGARRFSWRERLRWHFVARPRLLAADALLCPSHALAVRLIAYAGWGARRRTRVIANGVHPIFRRHSEEEVLAVRRRWLVPRRYVLMVETAGTADCLEVPLRALAQNEEVSSVTCIVVGRKGLPAALREAIRDCHLEGMVRFLPIDEVPAVDLAALMSGAVALFEPVRETDFRPTIAQALACGTPVICAAGASNKELFGNAVLRVHPTDPAEWAKAFSAVTLSTALCERLARRAQEQMAERTWTATAKALFAVGRELCGEEARA